MTETEVLLHNNDSYSQPTGLFINGKFVQSRSKASFETINPFPQKPICSVARGSHEDVHDAVCAAKQALPQWVKLPAQRKMELLRKLSDLLKRDAELVAWIESIDGGKPVKIAKTADVDAAADCLRYFAGWADKLSGETVNTDSGSLNMILREPYGVCGLIVPISFIGDLQILGVFETYLSVKWNFPLLIAAWKIGPALATGNTVVLKPAELTPLSALYLGKLVVEAGFPPGVVNIVTGYGNEAGSALTSHPDVRKISFTGSTKVGRSILATSAQTNLKKVSLELGGKSPIIVFESADLDKVVEWVNGGIFYNIGQNCCAGSRIYVQDAIYERFIEKFVARARQNLAGCPYEDENVFLGPQISEVQFKSIMRMIEKAKSEGAVCATGGQSPSGWFIEPTIFRDVTQAMSIAKEEVFGPVAIVAPFKTTEDALSLANDTNYGLAAGVFTERLSEALYLVRGIEAGSIWVNCYNKISHQLPFGGVKESGDGRDLGEAAIEEFQQGKTVRLMS